MRKAAFIALLFVFGAPAFGQETRTPTEVVRQTTDAITDAVTTQREELQKNPDRLYKLVEEKLLPVFDYKYTARLVLGHHWRTASETQRQQFLDAFYDFLVHVYANGLLQYDNEKIVIQPPRGEPDPRHTFVRTEIHTEDGKTIPVDYVLHKTEQGWQAFDVIIEGISYVTNYRNSFHQEITQTSLDALIRRLEKQAAEARENPGSDPVTGTEAGAGKAGEKAST